jgi:hypothetical protein
MIGNPRYGTVGLLAMPYYTAFEMLGPIVEMLGYLIVPLSYALGCLNTSVLQALFAVAVLYAVVVSVASVLLDDVAFRRYRGIGQLASLASAAVVEAVVFRPLCSFWRIGAFWHHFRRDLSWGKMERKGLGSQAAD